MKGLEQLKLVFNSFHEAIYIVDKERKIVYFNPVACQMTGFSSNETVGFFCYDNILNHVDETGKHLCLEGCPLVTSIAENKVLDHIVYFQHKEGHRVRVHVRTIPYLEEGEVVGAIEVFTDKATPYLLQAEIDILKRLNMADPLTGLFNRRFMDEMLEKHLHKHDAQHVGLLFIDLDCFKSINDTYGHAYGDEVLKTVAKTIVYHLKQKDVVIRYGGDEFVVVLLDVEQDALMKVADGLRILIENSRPRMLNISASCSASIGATLKSEQESIEQAIQRADKAMYDAKRFGKNCVFYLD